MKDHVVAPQQQAGTARMTHQRIACRKRVIESQSGEPKAQYERRGQPHQAFFEVRGFLFGDKKHARRVQIGQVLPVGAVQVADHPLRPLPEAARHIRATICRYDPRSEQQSLLQGLEIGFATAQERDRFRERGQYRCHGGIDDD